MIEAGSETTSSALNSCILHLAAYPSVQHVANAELTSVVGDERSPSFSDKEHLPYIRAMGKEILRIRPVTTIGSPHYTTSDVLYKDYRIPKDVVVAIPQYLLHFDSAKWDHPEVFDPSRYLAYPEKAGVYAAQGNPDARDHYDFGARLGRGVSLVDPPLSAVQAKFLLAFYATFSGEQDLASACLGETGFFIMIYNRARQRLQQETSVIADMTWSHWVQRESWKRVLAGLYISGTMRTVIYGINPLFNSTKDLDVEMLHSDALWNAQSSGEWLGLQAQKESSSITTSEAALVKILSGTTSDLSMGTNFSMLLLTHATLVHTWHLRQTAEILGRSAPQGSMSQSLLREGLATLGRCRALFHTAKINNPDDSDETDILSLPFSSYVVCRASYVRLVDNTTSFNRLCLTSGDSEAIASSVAAFASRREPRSAQLLEVVGKTLKGFQLPFKMGHLLVRKTAAFRWSVEHAIASWDAGLLVTKWVHSVEVDAVNGIEPSPRERDLLADMKDVLEEADYDPDDSRSFAASLARIWSFFLQDFRGVKYADLSHWYDEARLIEYHGSGLVAERYGPQAVSDPEGVHGEHLIIQRALPVGDFPGISGVDCLNLNVTIPRETKGSRALPVLVFIHGGGFMTGSNWWPQYDTKKLVQLSVKKESPIVAVTINYRLGAPGFLTSKDLRAAGFKSFGGDPEQVTVVGESAGGISTVRLLHAKEPLASRIVVLGGSPPALPPMTAEAAEGAYEAVVEALGFEKLHTAGRIEALCKTRPEELLEKIEGKIQFLPVVDGDTVPDIPTFEAAASGTLVPRDTACKSVMVGYAPFDGSIFGFVALPQRRENIAAAFTQSVTSSLKDAPDVAAKLLKAYGIDDGSKSDEEAFVNVLQLASDIGFQAPARRFAASFPGDSYLVEFAERNPWDGPFKGFGTHVLDVAFLFQNYNEHLDAGQRASAELFAADVVDFTYGKVAWEKHKDGNGPAVYQNGTRAYKEGDAGTTQRYRCLMELGEAVGLDALMGVWEEFLFPH
ncbi:Cytochrome P450 monooxygenase patI [Colletotrichum spinosum]|uniref:Cytochrome P450 monooxygenase patI n=1 Tax=Colletotrichum spinosum TaxID=1347390 RepID=A0A4R8PZD9_9PEZI|nr:Cytochrome P450 monooxygenase patI [Colletotrichum spinosum]